MSIKQIVKVWEHEFTHFEQAVMLALADHADDDGRNIRPSVAHIAWKTGYKERRVQEILKGLREERKILKLVAEGGGRGNPTEYEFDWSKAAPKRPWEEIRDDRKTKKGANNAPFTEPEVEPERVHSEVERVHSDVKRVHSEVERVRPSAPEPSEPSENRHEPSEEERGRESPDVSLEVLPDDSMTRCLVILKKVPGFPRDQAENALYLAELREEYPLIDPVYVCREYEVWHRDNPGKTKNYRQRLRRFFENKERDRRSGKPIPAPGEFNPGRRNGKEVSGGADRPGHSQYTENYEFLFEGQLD